MAGTGRSLGESPKVFWVALLSAGRSARSLLSGRPSSLSLSLSSSSSFSSFFFLFLLSSRVLWRGPSSFVIEKKSKKKKKKK